MDKIKEMYETQKAMDVNRFIRRRYEGLSALFPKGSRILDIGCKDGSFAQFVDPSCEYIGVDISDSMLTLAKQKGVEVLNADITSETLPFEDNSFDIIVMAEILEHLDSHIRALTEARRLLKAQGQLIITVPNPEGLKRELDSMLFTKKRLLQQKQGEHICAFGTREIMNLLLLCDFTLQDVRKINPEIGEIGLMLPNWRLFSFLATNVLAIARPK